MRQFPLESLDLAPGRVVRWRLRSRAAEQGPGAAGGPVAEPDRRASFNQDKHFTVAEQSRRASEPVASWLAVTFEIAGPLDRAALEAALLHLAHRHEVLRCEFRRLAGEVACAALDPSDLLLEAAEVGTFDCPEDLRAFLADDFGRSIDTLAWPLYTMGAVLRPDATTVYLAFDHIVCDGMSMPAVINDVQRAYAAFAQGRPADPDPAPSYLDFAHEQRGRYLSIAADDDRLAYWRAFTARNGGFFPPFPLDLGVEPGRMYPIANVAGRLLDAAETEAFDRRCRAVDGRAFMGVLAAVAAVLRRSGGPEVYRGLMPVSERGRGPWQDAVGWFVNTMPIEFPVGPGLDFAEVMAGVRAGFGTMMAHTEVPFVRAWELLAPEEFAARSWPFPVNFFSYLDMRRCPGAEHHEVWRPTTHVWSSGANGACSWFQRDTDGLHLNSIFVDTPQAHRTMAGFEQALRGVLRTIAATGTLGPAPVRRPDAPLLPSPRPGRDGGAPPTPAPGGAPRRGGGGGA
ncbi:condensation domain-containing protein, partial [Kitasatospora sp. NPDC059571]|uniref:condensation domain-containing protein n=1 Tax=Kitasatospora sp. NPDC059571 TaxID=3346871 RepID=UPI0036C62CE5